MITNFNSILVRLEAIAESFLLTYSVYFNSTLVRLAGLMGLLGRLVSLYFNSTLVRLEVDFLTESGPGLFHFTSTLVRLEATEGDWIIKGVNGFQFHPGTIRRLTSQLSLLI